MCYSSTVEVVKQYTGGEKSRLCFLGSLENQMRDLFVDIGNSQLPTATLASLSQFFSQKRGFDWISILVILST